MNRLLSVDWGTSNFRIRLVDTDTGNIIAEKATADGISSVYAAWKESNVERKVFYTSVLGRNIATLGASVSATVATLPIIISGMASSTLGINELPYADLPFNADGSSVGVKKISVDGFDHPTWLISGLSSRSDVMRGEETQWIGLMQASQFAKARDLLFVLPGTHSKHIFVASSQITDFKTYMTGEFYNLLANFSVLKNSVDTSTLTVAPDEQAFIDGVNAAIHSNLLHESFMVRTNDLFGRFNQKQNASYLSGVLIGTELKGIDGYTIVLAAGAGLTTQYSLALQHVATNSEIIICPSDQLEKSVVMGQLTIFKKLMEA